MASSDINGTRCNISYTNGLTIKYIFCRKACINQGVDFGVIYHLIVLVPRLENNSKQNTKTYIFNAFFCFKMKIDNWKKYTYCQNNLIWFDFLWFWCNPNTSINFFHNTSYIYFSFYFFLGKTCVMLASTFEEHS